MSDPFFDNYYKQTKERLEQAKQAYRLVHLAAGGAIESQFLSRFDLKDPRRSKATLRSVSGIRGHLKSFEHRLVETDKTIAFAAIQRDQFVSLAGLEHANDAFHALRGAGSSADDPLDLARQALADLTRLREGFAMAIENMDVSRRKANLQVGALRDAIATTLLGRVELVSAFSDTELPVIALQAIKALRDVSAERAAEQIGEALIEAVKTVAPEIAAELVRVASIVRTYKALAEAFGAHEIDTTPNAVEAVQRLWEAMEAEEHALAAIDVLAAKVAREITAP